MTLAALNRSLRMLVVPVFAGTVALASGCAHEYLYLPTGGTPEGGPAASYPIPPQAPEGQVYVTSFGFADVKSPPRQSGALLHIRLAVSNGSGTAWSVDTRDQKLLVVGQAPTGPSYVNTEAGRGPVYQVAPGRASAFDLYFRLPPGLDKASQLAGFTLDWSVNAGGQRVADATTFRRHQEAPEGYDDYPAYVSVGLGWGLGWWGIDPFFPGGPPFVDAYFYPPGRIHAGPWRGPRPGGWRGGRPAGPHPGFHGGPQGAGRR